MGHIAPLNGNRLLSVEKHREWIGSHQYQYSKQGEWIGTHLYLMKKLRKYLSLCLQIWRVKRETLDSFSTFLGNMQRSIMDGV